jgi:mono/diheme cytochrome c family protein
VGALALELQTHPSMKWMIRASVVVALAGALPAYADGNAAAGRTIFTQYCAVCHGPQGHGDGPGSAGLNPKPANFGDAARRATPEDKQVRIVTKGGAAEKLSPVMPPFSEALNPQQVRDVVAFIRSTFQQADPTVTPSPR